MSKLTMVDIARLAGVSASTVSRALNGSPSIPQKTRERILKIAEEQHYILDSRAQNFRLQRSQTIAVLFPYTGQSSRLISDPFYMEMTGAISDAVDAYGYDLIVARVPSDQDAWCSRYVQNKRVDGIILIDRAIRDRGIDRLRELGAKFIVWGQSVEGEACVSVGGDSLAGAAMAVQHLAGLGRRRIGFIGGSDLMVETATRYRGYVRGLDACGLPLDPALVTYTDFSPQAGSRAIHLLLDREPALDSVFVCSDFMSIAIMQEIQQRGLRIPDDIAVVGYDDITLAAHCTPRLTTIRQHIHVGGALLVEKLFAMMEGGTPESALLPVELVMRDSCGGKG